MFGSFSFSVHNQTYQTSIDDSENINDYKSLEVTSTLKEKRTSPKHLCFTDEATELSTAKGSSSSWMVRSTLSIPFFSILSQRKTHKVPVGKRRRRNVEESTHKEW